MRPSIDCGATAPKRVVGDRVAVEAEVVASIPLAVGARLRYRPRGERGWRTVPLSPHDTEPDRYVGEFELDAAGRWEFRVDAWVDEVATWKDELARRLAGGQTDFSAELAEAKDRFGVVADSAAEAIEADLRAERHLVRSAVFPLAADPPLAKTGAWYELFPRSFGGLRGVAEIVPQLADLGFDVLYLPPIHPIGATNRKGRDNALSAGPDDPGSPWAIGSADGGHTAIDPSLGTMDDFSALVEAAETHGVAVALDLALQCSPDHPWLRAHPEWFRWRPDGSVKFAENPPKRYEDIVNFDFSSPQWRELWEAVADIVRFWVAHGVRIFRVDNPHTKPFGMWSHVIDAVRAEHPDVFFLAEAFTRPAIMRELAKCGFSQSYTYFTWRNTSAELAGYVEELSGAMHEYFRPNFFVNTPDILTSYLQRGGAPAFRARLVLAALLSPSYGIYSGFENVENVAVAEGSEEYLHSEKYELKARALDGPLLPLVRDLNAIRRSSPVFSDFANVRVLDTQNDGLFAFAKTGEDERFVVCVNIDPSGAREGLLDLPPELGLPARFSADDVLGGGSFQWRTGGNYVRLNAGHAHVCRVG